MERDVPRPTLDQPGMLVPGNAIIKTGEVKSSDKPDMLLDQTRVKERTIKPVTGDHVLIPLKEVGGAANRGNSAAAPAGSSTYANGGQDTRQSLDRAGRVIIDTESLKVEQLKGPDHLDEQRRSEKGLQEYLQEGTIKPVTGDQVVYRLKEAGAAGGAGSGDSSGAQVAVLGSPTVPVGLSSALGYMRLGQVARVQVAQHLMEHGAADDTGEITPLPDSHSTPKAAATSPGAASGTPANRDLPQQQQQQPATHAATSDTGPQQLGPPPAAGATAAGSRYGQPPQARFSELQTMWRQRSVEDKGPGSPRQQQLQQQQDVGHGGGGPADIHMPRAAGQAPARHPKGGRPGLAAAAVPAATTAAGPAAARTDGAAPNHRLESIPSDEALPLASAASDHSSWLADSRGSRRSSFSSTEDAEAARTSSSQPAGHLNGGSSGRQQRHVSIPAGVAAVGGVVPPPGTGSSSSRVGGGQAGLSASHGAALPGQQSPSGWSSGDHSATGVPAVPPVSQPSTDSASFRVWMGNSSSGGAMGQPAHVAGHGPGSAAGAAAAGAVRSSTLQQLQPAGTAASVQQQQPQQQQPGRGPAGVGSGSGSDVATCGSNQEAGGGDGRGSVGADAVAYELEVLAIVPGRGSLTGQPVLSDAARQQQAPPLDVRGLSHDVEPHLQPPKQLKGCSGWVRRHLSLNMRAPGKAGKQGLSWLGLAGCCSSQKGGEKRGQQQQQQKPAYG